MQHLEGVQILCRAQQLAEQALGLILRHSSRPPVPRTPCHTVELHDVPLCFGAALCPVGLSSWQNRRLASSSSMPPARMCQRQPCQAWWQHTALIIIIYIILFYIPLLLYKPLCPVKPWQLARKLVPFSGMQASTPPVPRRPGQV